LFSGRPGDLSPVAGLEGHAITTLTWDGSTDRLWVGTESGLMQLQRAGDGWQIAQHFTVNNSGLAADHVTALALIPEEAETYVWIGTPCGLSCYCDRR
jgi:ligand-binding sensor domain-containing protein